MRVRGRKWLSLLLAICMVLGMLPAMSIPAAAADGNCTGDHTGWALPTNLGGTLIGDRYYLNSDITATDEIAITGNVTLCLNGHKLDLNGHYITVKSGSFTLCDCQNAGKITNSSNRLGAVQVDGGSFLMYGGSIADNFTCGVVINVDSSFVMYGGSISNNTQKASDMYSCGGVAVGTNASFTMHGGSITNNSAELGTQSAGGVFILSGNFTMTGGEITGNTVTGNSGGFFGCAGGVCMSSILGGSIAVSGDVTISGNTAKGTSNNISLSDGQKIDIGSGGLTGGEVGVTVATSDVFTAGGGADYQQYFFSDDDQYIVTKSGSELTLGKAIENPHKHCICGESICNQHEQKAYTVTSALGSTLGAGNYYLKHSITATDDITITDAVNLCLNGRTLDLDGHHVVVTSGGSLTICDCGANGTITGGAAEQGGAILVNSGGSFTLHSGTISGNTASGRGDDSSGSNRAGGGAVCVNGGSFTMAGGSIENNASEVTAKNDGGGGVLLNSGRFEMTGGSITGNSVAGHANSVGGGVHVNGGTFTMTNGTISGNRAPNGGGVAVFKGTTGDSSFFLSGGSIIGNSTENTGGGIYVLPNAAFHLSGAPAINSNTAAGAASNIYLNNNTIALTDTLSNAAAYGVSMQNPGQFTSGWTTYMSGQTATNFFTSDDSKYKVKEKNGELRLMSGYIVSFNLGGTTEGTVPPDQEVETGGKVQQPTTDPTWDGHTFAGWYNGDALWDFGTVVTSNMTLTAKWITNPKVTVSGEQTLTYGTGGTLTAVVTPDSGQSYTYQWYCNGSAIRGATTSSYTVPATTSVGTYTYSCAVTASITGSSVTASDTSADLPVTVNAKKYSSTDFTIAPISPQTYTGRKIEPDDVSITFGGETLVKGADYTLGYGENTDAGTDAGSVKITFRGNYSGETTVYFDIVYATLTGDASNDTVFEDYTNTSNNWSNSDSGVTFTPQDGWTVSTTPGGDYEESITFHDERDGEYTKTVYVKDSSDNIYQTEITYKLDKTDPEVSELEPSVESDTWTSGDVTVSFTASDATSGIQSVTVSKDGDSPAAVTPDSDGNYTFPAAENGEYTFTVTDAASNTTEKTIEIKNIDRAEPTLTITGGMESREELTLIVEASDHDQSGIANITVSGPGNPTLTADKTFIVSQRGTYIITVTDKAGNEKSETINIHSITFHSNGGSEIVEQLVVSGGKVTRPANPIRTGYSFDCWMDGEAPWNFTSNTVLGDLTLTAKWTLDAPTVELSADKSNAIYGETITLTAGVTHAAGNGITSYTYQWYKDDSTTPIPNANDSTLTLTDVDESGSYSVKVTAKDADGLTVEETSNTVTVAIAKATPTLSVDAVTITYGDQLTDNLLQGTASSGSESVSGSFAWGDSKTGTMPAVADSGQYTVRFTPADMANYTTATTTITLTVNRKVLTPTVTNVQSKTYDGNTFTTGTIRLTGAVNTNQPTASGEFTFVDANAGDNKPVNVVVTLDDSWGDNYVLSTDSLTAKADITPKTVGLTWSGYEDLVYDGQPVSVTAAATGLIGNDQCTVLVKDGDKIAAGSYTAEATGLDNDNYALPADGITQDYIIAKRPVELSWSESSFTYDGMEKTVTAQIENLVENDVCALTYEDNQKTVAGSYEAKVTDLGNDNYTLTGGTGLTHNWTIQKAVISFEVTDNSYIYDGETKIAEVAQTESEPTKIGTDKYTVTYGEDNSTSQTSAGTYDITVTIGDPNFCFAGGDSSKVVGQLVIAPKQATVTWQNLNQVYGDRQQVTVLIDGLVDGDSAENAVITGIETSAGSYPLSVTLANYQLSNDTATLVIQQKPVVITVTDNAVTAGGEPTINAPGLQKDDYTVTYKDKNGNVVETPTQPGTYEVWVTFPEDSNYRHPDGSSDKQVGSLTITETQPVLYTVTFDGNGNTSGTMISPKLAGRSILTLPDCGYTKDKYQFTGWLCGGKTYKPGDSFTMPYDDVTFTAQWQTVFEVRGTIKEETTDPENTPEVGNAVVSLWLGANKIVETHTKADGTYSFGNLLPGIYNLVVSKDERIVTSMVEIISTDQTCNAVLPQYVTNSVVNVTPGSPDIVVGKLDTSFTEDDLSTAEEGGKVEFTFHVDEQQESEVGEDAVKDLQRVGGSNLSLFLDCTLTKTITDENGTFTSRLTQSSTVLEILLPLPAELQDKYSYTISRFHDGKAQTVPQGENNKNEDGEYFTVSKDKTVLILHVKNFSTYAVGYHNAPTTSTPTYPPVKNESENGSYTVSPSAPSFGQKVTITPKPDEGYVVSSVTVTDKNGKDVTVTPNADGTYTFTQPSGSVTITVTFQKDPSISDCPRDESCPIAQFSDVNRNAWYHDGVHYCVENGLMQGYGNGIFGPNNALSRAMLVQILYNLESRPAVSGESAFSDVASSAWYTDAVNWAAANGIVNGVGNGLYRPEDDITREQFAAILYRYAQYKNYDVSVGEDTNILSYSDALEVSEYAVPAMQWACGAGIIEGIADALDPTGNTTRAQAATMLMRFCTI